MKQNEDDLCDIGEQWLETNGPTGVAMLINDLETAEKEIERLNELLLSNGICPVCGSVSIIGWESGQYLHYCNNGHTHQAKVRND
jgi:hypothetical protein